jgi:dipeptidyl aminopeptidase/acylaminoacyl peptidase
MTNTPYRLLPAVVHSGFSVRAADGAVACLRDDVKERWLLTGSSGDPAPRHLLVSESQMRALVADEEGNAPRDEAMLQPPVWSPDGERLAFGYGGVWTVGADGSGLRRLSTRRLEMPGSGRGAAGNTNLHAERNAYLAWHPSGASVFFLSTGRQGAVTLFQADAEGRWERKLIDDVPIIPSFAVSPSGRSLAAVVSDGVTTRIRLLELDHATTLSQDSHLDAGTIAGRPLYRHAKLAWLDDERVVLRGSGHTGWSRHELLRLDRSGRLVHERQLTEGTWEDGEMVLSPDGHRAVLSSLEGTPFEERLWELDLHTKERRLLLAEAEPGFRMPVAWAETRIYFTYASPAARGDLYVLETSTGTTRRLTFSDDRLTCRTDFQVETVTLDPGHDGSPPLPILLLVPAAARQRPLPAIVWCHGGPAMAVHQGWQHLPAWLANAGFVVAIPAFRGSTGLGEAFMQAGYGENLGAADLQDVLRAGRYLSSRADVDPARLGVAGRSWGGYLTLRTLTHPEGTDLFRCGWAAAAIADWEIQQAETEVRYYDYQLLGGLLPESGIRAHARDRSPIHHLDLLTQPILLTHGRKDRDVPFRQMESFVEAARQAGNPSIAHEFFEDEGHTNKRTENILTEASRALAFLRMHLVPWDLTSNPSGGQAAY